MPNNIVFMKRNIVFITSIFVFISTTITFAQPEMPSSRRSREAIIRVRPRLESALSKIGLRFGSPIFIRVFKKPYKLEVWIKDHKKFKLFKTYKICTYGFGTLGPKVKQGDGQAPEGFYFVSPKSMNPLSTFHLSFNIGYPNAYDKALGRTGGHLMVHGSCVSIGCYAITDSKIEEIYALADTALLIGRKFFRVHIFPFEMTKKNILKHRESQWLKFWKNIKKGYDFFEKTNIPPDVLVKNKRYVFKDALE